MGRKRERDDTISKQFEMNLFQNILNSIKFEKNVNIMINSYYLSTSPPGHGHTPTGTTTPHKRASPKGIITILIMILDH